MTRTSVIAIDGPAASGKSSTAQLVAEKLGYLHVDSGSLYRAATAAILRTGMPPSVWTEQGVLDAVRRVELRAARTSFYPVLEGRAIEDEIRGADVTRHVSRVAQMPRVREWVNGKVREAAESRDIVVDGRDMGTVVFPRADLKIFLVADSRERAARRLRQRGTPPSEKMLDDETIQINERDARDARQTVPAADAVVIDTTGLAQQEQVEQIVTLSKQRGV
ncbi:MAG: (d)CMP kinase [Gemmatimonadaceae bacterium]